MDLHPNTLHSWLSHSNGKLIFKPPTASDELSLAKRSSCEFVNNADDSVDIISFRYKTRLLMLFYLDNRSEYWLSSAVNSSD